MKSLQIICLLVAFAAANPSEVKNDIGEVFEAAETALQVTADLAPFADDVETAKQALEVIRNFIEIFNSDIFEAVGVKPIAEIVSKIFSFVISIINLIQGVGPQESAEMKFLREQFKEVHSKLDSISLQLDDVKRLIEWQTTRVMYAQYESFIAATSHLLDSYVSAHVSERDVLKRHFLTAFQSNPLATLKLYQAVVETDFVVSSNLGTAVAHYTQNHRRHSLNFLLAIQRLVMRGAQLEIAYEKMVHGDSAAEVTKSLWNGRMEKLLTRMKQVESDIKNAYQRQLESDVDRVILDKRQLSNKDFSTHIHKFISDKFDWRFWFAVAYKDVAGFDNHALRLCPGSVSRFRTNGNRNVAVASADPKTTRFTKARGNMMLDAAQKEGSGSHADTWTKLIDYKMGQSCDNAALIGSICWGCDVWYEARDDRLVYRRISKNGDINAFIFG